MNILMAHNEYRQPGGEDQVFRAESALLVAHGHRVARYTAHNDSVSEMGRAALALATLWNTATYDEVRALIRRERPRVAHFHNTFPLVSPAAYYAARAEGVPVVQTLHNYRLLCPTASFFREGRVCEDCLGKPVAWPGVVHACYRGDRAASGVVAAMLAAHRALGTWAREVDLYIALTDFARDKFVEGGMPAGKIVVKPNFLEDASEPGEGSGDYALYVGRLAPEKGLDVLLAAWEGLGGTMPLKVVGDGPLADRMADAAGRLAGVSWLGARPRERVLDLMREARVLVFPSTWYEGFPMVILEAFASGLPVIASDLGGMSSIVDHGRTGLHFRPGDPVDLAEKVRWAAGNRERLDRMRPEARGEFEAKYTAERNYELLMRAYAAVVD